MPEHRQGPRQAPQKRDRPGAATGGRAIRLPAGFEARMAAAQIVEAVLDRQRTLDEALDAVLPGAGLEPRDRAFARLLAATVLRRTGTLEALLNAHLQRRPREGLVWPILLTGAAQLAMLDTPPHAAISLAVDLIAADRRSHHLKGLVNAVLRKVAANGPALLAATDPVTDSVTTDIPKWLLDRWSAAYGANTARDIAVASLNEAALDISVKSDADGWAQRLGGIVLPTGSVRVLAKGQIEALPGFDDGEWWIQDTAATLPPRLLGPVEGLRVADLCAAPGGKTAWLAAAGAVVTAVDSSQLRLQRLRTNLDRLRLTAEIVEADINTWRPDALFDAVLLDAPCTATGTLRRHPDILRIRTAVDVTRLATIQADLLEAAARLVRPGGRLVYCTCSLEAEEGPDQIQAFLSRNPSFERQAVVATDVGGLAEVVTADGDVRTLPSQLAHVEPGYSGIDGFYIARLVRRDA
ncbi:MAG: transcription antitermination factor NusB [Hyphomicrobium aestuarii]|nr:transcription antitermination factor NusB [Hyphomicrobium aestuarii]